MKKLLLGSAAIIGVAAFSGPAMAEDGGVKLDVGGYFKGYVSWLDQDETSDDPATVADESEDVRDFEIVRDTEVHFTGESTLDNGLTVGFHTELEDDHEDGFGVNESYGYFSCAWGRMNLGAEDGAAYLLQVAAPSADSNVDGIRQYVQPVNYDTVIGAAGAATDTTIDDLFNGLAANDLLVDADGDNAVSADDILLGANGAGTTSNFRFDYDHAVSASDDKITYLTPVFSGFQFGVSFTPNLDGNSIDDPAADGHTTDNDVGDYGNVWDLAARYEGQWDQLGVAIGAGWTHAELESDDGVPFLYRREDGDNAFTAGVDTVIATLDDREAWNVGVDLDWSAFGIGAGYLNDDNGVGGDEAESETWVVGIDYTTGPFKLGGTYYNQDQNLSSAEFSADRWTGGVVYTYGPGMTFRGSISFIDLEEDMGNGVESSDADATSFLFGTQINF